MPIVPTMKPMAMPTVSISTILVISERYTVLMSDYSCFGDRKIAVGPKRGPGAANNLWANCSGEKGLNERGVTTRVNEPKGGCR